MEILCLDKFKITIKFFGKSYKSRENYVTFSWFPLVNINHFTSIETKQNIKPQFFLKIYKMKNTIEKKNVTAA